MRCCPGPRARPTFDDVAASVEVPITATRVRSALGPFTAPQREAVERAYFGGHPYSRVAQLVGVPLGTVKSRIRAALIALREAMTET